jgi:hypothetical protein
VLFTLWPVRDSYQNTLATRLAVAIKPPTISSDCRERLTEKSDCNLLEVEGSRQKFCDNPYSRGDNRDRMLLEAAYGVTSKTTPTPYWPPFEAVP